MTDELITLPKAVLDAAILKAAIEAGPTPTTRSSLASAILLTDKVMLAIEEPARAYARSTAARNAAMVKHHGTQFQPTLPPVDAPQPLQNDAGAAIPTLGLPLPTPKRSRHRRTKAEIAAANAATAVAQQLAQQPATYSPPPPPAPVPMGAPFSEPFAPTPMPQAPFTQAQAPQAQPQPQPAPYIPPPPPPPGAPAQPPHPFGVRPE
jgi:hypothetical protein